MTSSTSSMASTMPSVDHLKKISLDMDPDMALARRKYPSVGEYYFASRTHEHKPIQLQKGLSNFSSLQLGDDRIAFNESILTGSYRVAVEDKMTIPSPSKDKTKHYRKREYEEASTKVGETEINRLERVMKDKLFQRSYMTSSPFQVRKAFKFFDRENAMTIPIEGFEKALEFLGFQFSDLQNVALFARYDPECTGTIDYMYFIAKAMFYGADDYLPVPKPVPIVREWQKIAEEKKSKSASDSLDEKKVEEAELRRIFNKASGGGAISRDQFEVFLMALGYNLMPSEINAHFTDLGIGKDQLLDFDYFYEWWQSEVGGRIRFKF